MLENDEIKPSAPSPSTSRDSPFSSDFLQVRPNIIQKLGREWTSSDTGSVSFDDTNDFANLLRWKAKTGTNAADGSVGRSDIRVCAEIEVEHECVSAFY